MRLTYEVEGVSGEHELPTESAALVAFMSFAVSRGFGATHPLVALADRLHDRHRVRLGPLTTFYQAGAEDAEDVAKLDLAWQEPAPLRDALLELAAAIEEDEDARTFVRRAGAEPLAGQARTLAEALTTAAGSGARVRLEYHL